ncbi:MAG: HK97-fold major capsid protein [candidate division WOR-3 bacterium]
MMSWAEAIKKKINTPTLANRSGNKIRTAGIYEAQNRFRQAVHEEADKLPRYAGVDHNGRPIVGREGTMFTRGEVNAWDKKDALEQITYASSQMGKVRGAALRKASELSQTEKEALLSLAYSKNQEDRLKFAQKPISIVYDRLDYVGFTDDVLQRMDIGQGAVPYVEHDVNVPAVVVAEDAKTIKTSITGNRTYFEEFRLTSLVTADVGEIAQRAYSIIDRIFEKVPRQIALEEDRLLLKAMYNASGIKNTPITFTTLNKATMDQFALMIERHRLDAEKFILNRADFSDIRTSIRADEFDPITSRDMFVSGYMGTYYGYKLYVTAGIDEDGVTNETVPAGHVFVAGGPRFVGYQGIRIPLDVYPADQFVNGEFSYGWAYFTLRGLIISNPRAVAFGIRSSTSVASWLL